MTLWDVLLDVWQNGGQVVVLGSAGYAGATVRAAPVQVAAHDRRTEILSRDLRRWIHDRDRQLAIRARLIEAYARNPDLEGTFVDEFVALHAPVPEELKQFPAGPQYDSGAYIRWQTENKETALHQYRNRATETLDQLDAIRASEGRWHLWVRRRRRLPAPKVVLGPAELQIVTRWRAHVSLEDGRTSAVMDASRAEGETRLRELEGDAP